MDPALPGPVEALARAADGMAARPVRDWHPAHCGDSHMRILASGEWLHEGRPIARPELVRLFASILRREPDGGYVLVTPGEKLTIAVEDAPFVAVELATEGEGATRRLAFRLNTGDVVVAGPAHALTMVDARPYLAVRDGLTARIARAVFYELAEFALAEGHAGLTSDGVWFALA